MALKVTDEEFAQAWRELRGHARRVGERLGISERATYLRRNIVEKRTGWNLPSGGFGTGYNRGDAGQPAYNYNPRINIDNFSGTVVVFSDCHWWPGISETISYKALIKVIRTIKPNLIVGNGDLLDGARISRHPPLGWENRPKLPAELEEVRTRCSDIFHAHRGARFIRTVGNHDARFEKYLAERASEFDGLLGTRLIDHIPNWEETMSIHINNTKAVIKHRWHGGIHAAYNNTLRSGTTFVSGHTHELEAKPFTDYHGTRYGVQTGTLADMSGPQFAYAEDNPTRGRQGFVVLTFTPSGGLLSPELCEMHGGEMYFRGRRV